MGRLSAAQAELGDDPVLLLSLLFLFLREGGAHTAIVNLGCGMSPSKRLCPKTHLNTLWCLTGTCTFSPDCDKQPWGWFCSRRDIITREEGGKAKKIMHVN